MDWLNIVRANREKIIKAMEKANLDALINTHLRYIVNIDKSGDVWTMEDLAGGNAFSATVARGNAIELWSYCHQCFNGNVQRKQAEYKSEQLNEDFEAIKESLKHEPIESEKWLNSPIGAAIAAKGV